MIEGNTNMNNMEEKEKEEESVTPSIPDDLNPQDSNTIPVAKKTFSSENVKPLEGFSSLHSTV
jgi:hypothetical protein